MKIGILTVYDSFNMGSYLQAYAMAEQLKKIGHEVVFIKYRKRFDLIKKFIICERKLILLHPIYYFKKFMIMKNMINELERKSIIYRTEELKKLDCIIIGSDELWNITNSSIFNIRYFFGLDEFDSKTIVYAMSCGEAKYSDFEEHKSLINRIEKLQKISYRDDKTKELLEKVKTNEQVFCADPTIIYSGSLNVRKIKFNLPEKYILVYGYHFTLEQVKLIKKLANNLDYKLLSVCQYINWCDVNIMCNPLEFSDLINKSQYVVTSTFHGSILSLLNNKEFVAFPRVKKVNDLLKRVGAEDIICNVDNYEQLLKCLEYSKKNRNKINNNINKLRKESMQWLEDNLNILE